MNKIKAFFTDSNFRFSILASRGFLNWMSDEQFIKTKYKLAFGKELDLEFPRSYNEKLQWLKLYNRRPEYTLMVDKYEAKKYVAIALRNRYRRSYRRYYP